VFDDYKLLIQTMLKLHSVARHCCLLHHTCRAAYEGTPLLTANGACIALHTMEQTPGGAC
jgi:hypothetical protein